MRRMFRTPLPSVEPLSRLKVPIDLLWRCRKSVECPGQSTRSAVRVLWPAQTTRIGPYRRLSEPRRSPIVLVLQARSGGHITQVWRRSGGKTAMRWTRRSPGHTRATATRVVLGSVSSLPPGKYRPVSALASRSSTELKPARPRSASHSAFV